MRVRLSMLVRPRVRQVALPLAAVFLTGACAAAGGTSVATAVTLATANPLIGAGAGLAAGWAADKAGEYQTALLHDAIAEAGGEADPAETVPWIASDRLPVTGDPRGTVTVTETPADGDCKAVQFTIVEGQEDQLGDYAGTVCPDDGGWQLAEARPLHGSWWMPPDERAPKPAEPVEPATAKPDATPRS